MELDQLIRDCKKCSLCQDLPNGCYPVPGNGNIAYNLMIVGEAPGETEIEFQMPFVGLAGQMLNQILESVDINREKCYLTNALKCRPTTNNGRKNRPPSKNEITICSHWLFEEIKSLQPKVIITLGKIPTLLLLSGRIKTTFKMQDISGNKFKYDKTTIIPTYHPSFLLQYGKKYLNNAIQAFQIAKEEIDGIQTIIENR